MESNFNNLITPLGRIAWCDVFDPAENPMSGQLGWSIGLELTDDDAADIVKQAIAALEQHRKEDPSFPASNKDINKPWMDSREPKNPDGSLGAIKPGLKVLKFNRKTQLRFKGRVKENTPPIVVDAYGRPMTSADAPGGISNGSIGRVRFDIFCYSKGQSGVGFGLRGLQVKELASGGGCEFDALEDGFSAQHAEETEAVF